MSHEMEILPSPPGGSSVPLPLPRVAVVVRVATHADLPFIDSLQKKNTKQVGWFPTKSIEGKIARGHVLIAEESGQCSVVGGQQDRPEARSSLATDHRELTTP